MGKLRCTCGHLIIDQTDGLPYKADILADREYFKLLDQLVESIIALQDALKTGKKQDWIKSHFQCPPYPTDLKDEDMISDLFTSYYVRASKTVYQCEQCGKIWIPKGQSDRFVPFSPDNDDWKNIFA